MKVLKSSCISIIAIYLFLLTSGCGVSSGNKTLVDEQSIFRGQSTLYKIQLTDLSRGILWEDARQRVEKREDNIIYLRVRAASPGGRNRINIPYHDKKFDEYLGSNKFFHSDDPEIVNLAKQIIGNESDAWGASQKLWEWVYKNLSDGPHAGRYDVKEILAYKTGACTQHAFVLAALTRAAGIPSKIAFGYKIYPSGRVMIHVWTEVYIGVWVAMDPHLGNKITAPDCLKIFSHPINGLDDIRDYIAGEYYRVGLDIFSTGDTKITMIKE